MQDLMELANEFAALTKRKREFEAELNDAKKRLDEIAPFLLDAIEEGKFPDKSRVDGMTIFVRRQLWASPKDGDYPRACALLKDAGLGDYVHERFNTQSISAFVREQEQQEIELHPKVNDALNITERFDLQARAA